MSAIAAFVLGLLVGWLIEWIIDWWYWRRRRTGTQPDNAALEQRLKSAEARSADLEGQLAAQKMHYSSLQAKLAELETASAATRTALDTPVVEPVVPPLDTVTSPDTVAPLDRGTPLDTVTPTDTVDRDVRAATPVSLQPDPVPMVAVQRDDLEIIKGIGPVIAGKLNRAGIYTFKDLAELTPDRLRELVGDVISRLANEEDILAEARQLAAQKHEGG